MTKRILSVILVLVVFFGGYAALPKKYNLLPTTDVSAAGVRPGAYKVMGTITLTKIVKEYRGTTKVYIYDGYTLVRIDNVRVYVDVEKTRTFKPGDVVSLNSNGKYDGYDFSKLVGGAYLKFMYG